MRGWERVGRNIRQEERKQMLVSRHASLAVRGRGMNPLIDAYEGQSIIGL